MDYIHVHKQTHMHAQNLAGVEGHSNVDVIN